MAKSLTREQQIQVSELERRIAAIVQQSKAVPGGNYDAQVKDLGAEYKALTGRPYRCPQYQTKTFNH